MNTMRTIIGFFFCLTLLSCNDVYYDRNGEKFKIFNQRTDGKIMDDEQMDLHPFNLNSFLAPNLDSTPSVQYILPSDIQSIVKKTGKLFIIFYNPNCPSGIDYVQMAKTVEKKDIPVMLIALINHPPSMKKWYDKLKMENKNYYILPSTKMYGNAALEKRIPFLSELCPSCYQQYKDELINTSFVIIKETGKEILFNFDSKAYTQEDGLLWLEENMINGDQ